jgi:hypothetical protein
MRRQMMWFAIGFLFVLALSVTFVWFDRAKVEASLLAKLIQKIEPSLPFQIENYRLGKNLDTLSMTLKFHGEEIALDGAIHWKWIKKNGIEISYTPEVSIVGASPFHLSLILHTERQWDKLDDLIAEVPATDFSWKKWGIDTKGFHLKATYDESSLDAETGFASVAWAAPGHSDQAVNLTEFLVHANLPDLKKPETGKLTLAGKNAEALFGNFYLALPLTQYPLTVSAVDGKSIDVSLGKDTLTAHADLDGTPSDFKTALIQFKAKPIPLGEFLPWAAKNLGSVSSVLKSLGDYEIKKGTLFADGTGVYEHEQKSFSFKKLNARVSGMNLHSSEKKLAAKNVDIDLNYSTSAREHSIRFQAQELDFRHFSAKLKPTTLTWDKVGFQIDSLPLEIKDLPLSIGKTVAKFKPEFNLETSLKLAPVDIAPIARGLCIPETKFPPISLKGDFSKIELSSSVIDPTGKVIATLFDGTVELNDIGIFELDTEVPETDLDIDWTGISMEKLNQWLSFGEVKGTLEGYAHDVVLQAALPTQYHFMINVAPRDRVHTTGRVEFSPEAMKNTIKLFSGSDIDQQIPGIAGWLMFGWPSHLMGGYDVYYAGMKLTSEDGHIVVETLDKPAIFEKEQKHFVLYGPRFKMPLTNTTYPLIVDAASMSNFVHQLLTQFQSIKQKKEGTTYEEESENPCDPPEF